MASLSYRQRLLGKVDPWQHRYRRIRVATMSLSLLVLALVPALGLARFDLWRGEHWVRREPVDGMTAFLAVCAGIVAFYVVTFVLNLFLGRLFCGWGCPVGQISRFGEQVEIARAGKRPLLPAYLEGGLFGVAMSATVMTWWVSPRVLWAGSAGEIALTLGALTILVLATFLHGRYWRWSFCRKLCPIGLYYCAVTAKDTFGIVFREDYQTCKDCSACDRICPVDLDPRHLDAPKDGIGGLAPDGLPSVNHCLACGDCVRACEWVFRGDGLPGDGESVRVPLLFLSPSGVQDTRRERERERAAENRPAEHRAGASPAEEGDAVEVATAVGARETTAAVESVNSAPTGSGEGQLGA